jgi:hypothetical protein
MSMIYVGNAASPDEKHYPVPRRKTDFIRVLENADAEATKHRASHGADATKATRSLLAKNVSGIRREINASSRRERRVADRRGS